MTDEASESGHTDTSRSFPEGQGADPVWMLVGEYPGSKEVGLTQAITAVRRVERSEYEAIESAIATFGAFSQTWDWHRIQAGVRTFLEEARAASDAYTKARAINQNDVKQISRSLASIASQVDTWLSSIEADSYRISGDLAPGRAADVVQQVSAREALNVLRILARTERIDVRFAKTDDVPGKILPIVIVAEPLGNSAPIGKAIRADSLVVDAFQLLEVVAARVLLDSQEAITAAAVLLSKIGAEVPGGLPAIVPEPRLRAAGEGKTQLPITRLPVGQVPSIMHAKRVAEKLTSDFETFLSKGASSSSMPETLRANAAGMQESNPQGSAPLSDNEGVIEDDGVNLSSSDFPVGQTRASGDSSASNELTLEASLAEVEAAVLQARQLSEEVEQAFSAALAKTDEWQAELFGQWSSIISILYRQIIAQSAALDQMGFSPRLPGMPLPPSAADGFQVRAEGQQNVTQLLVAQVDSIQDLLVSMKGLQEPTALKMEFPSGRSRTWWEIGAFATVSDLATVTMRVTKELNLLISNENSSDRQREFLDDLGAANLCLQRGLPEAALIYIHRSVSLLEKSGSLSRDEVENIFGNGREALREAARAVAEGGEVGLGFALPIARYWTQRIGDFARARIYGTARGES